MPDQEEVIRSRANPLIKRIGAVLAGKEPGTLLLEGERLVDDALRSGLPLEMLLVAEDRVARVRGLLDQVTNVRRIDPVVMQKLTSLKSSPGVLALGPAPAPQELETWRLDARTLILVVAGIADPGNLGALARSAEALGAQGIVACGGASPWNPKALRGSMGSLVRLPVCAHLDADLVRAKLDELGVRQVAASTRDGSDPSELDWTGPIALWIGSETGSLPGAADGLDGVSISMAGRVESLNVTVATSLLLYAAGRTQPEARSGSRG